MDGFLPATFETLFGVPQIVTDDDLKSAVTQLAEALKADLATSTAPVEVVMEASVCLNQFAKHMQASRQPYGYPDRGGYNDPGSERAALSSLHSGLATLREAMFKLRVVKVNPAQLQAALDERDQRFRRAVEGLFLACRDQPDPLKGNDLMFFVQQALFPLLREEGLVE